MAIDKTKHPPKLRSIPKESAVQTEHFKLTYAEMRLIQAYRHAAATDQASIYGLAHLRAAANKQPISQKPALHLVAGGAA